MVVLTMLSTALKDIAVENNVFVESGTQLSGNFEEFEGVRNQTLLRGSKGIADKIDMGSVLCGITTRDQNMLQVACRNVGMPMPTHVMDIYKLRRGRYKNVRIWGLYDLGTARWQDLFVTDASYRVINIGSPRVIYKNVASEEGAKEIEETVAAQAGRREELTAAKTKGKDSWSYGL